MRNLFGRFSERFRDLLLSVYLYNEWRGYTQLENDLIPALDSNPNIDRVFVSEVKKHAADERKHYTMFKGYFISKGKMPFNVGKSVGYFDFLARWLIGDSNQDIVHDEKRFARLCRAVVTTELRGIHQLNVMLKWPSVSRDERLRNIFHVIREDEPSHYGPYEKWLEVNGHRGPSWYEKISDCVLHNTIAIVIIPMHFFNFRLKRMNAFAA